ncbi:hypothetical protein CHISP_0257 [Chitinispirillum alkaliphilum]|nr:hypothetical protein CHISP_0257 [Chitinispirillum alkaliphilum]
MCRGGSSAGFGMKMTRANLSQARFRKRYKFIAPVIKNRSARTHPQLCAQQYLIGS